MPIKDFYKGNTIKYDMVFIKVSDNSPIDVSGWQIFVTFKHRLDDPDSLAVLQKVFTLPTDANTVLGLASITLESTDTDNFPFAGNYFYGFKRIIPGSPPNVYTLETGKIKILQNSSDIVVEHTFIQNVNNVLSATAQSTLIADGFIVGTITNEVSTTITSGNVIRTDPLQGSYEPTGSTVNLIVAS